MTESKVIKRRIDLKMQGLKLLEAKHRQTMQAEAEKIKALRLRLQEIENAKNESYHPAT